MGFALTHNLDSWINTQIALMVSHRAVIGGAWSASVRKDVSIDRKDVSDLQERATNTSHPATMEACHISNSCISRYDPSGGKAQQWGICSKRGCLTYCQKCDSPCSELLNQGCVAFDCLKVAPHLEQHTERQFHIPAELGKCVFVASNLRRRVI